ncbi:hypothetical protein GJV78_07700 [Escherichia alba]|jgi:ADP-heptose:LPS heptosyltransferase|uniref:Lipopolysaccharide heptosyltransferase family protein n=1 Tax=Intestinirhabdus alba TaxID=2899544 RepID=A0A6L6IJK5_9ENTR|nr:hypothetical protein [Intestinirhabdus alba]
MYNLTIYINGESSYNIYHFADALINRRENDVSLFFIKNKQLNLPHRENVMIFDFPETITAEWLATVYHFARKINAASVRIFSAVQYGETINFPLIAAFRQDRLNGLSLSLCLFESSFNDIISRQQYNALLNEGLPWRAYGKNFQQKLLTDSGEWDEVYNYLFNQLVPTQYYFYDFYKNDNPEFSSASHYRYLSDFHHTLDREAVNRLLSLLGAGVSMIDTLREVCEQKKTLFFVDDGTDHPLGESGKDACLAREIQNKGFEFVFLLNYKGAVENLCPSGVNILRLPEAMTLEVLTLAGITPGEVYGLCSQAIFAAKKENIKALFFHEDCGQESNKKLCQYLDANRYGDIPRLFINETQRRLEQGYTPGQIFLLADSMGDVLFAAGALNALRETLPGPFICIVPQIYHGLLSLCPWVDEIWPSESVSKEQHEEIYIARQLGNFHLPSAVRHIVDEKHQIDSFVEFTGQRKASPARKEIVLSLDQVDKTKVDAFLKENNLTGRVVLIHPNSGVANRTWPAAAWEALIERFLDDGWSVVLIGSNNNFYSHKKTVEINNSRVFNAIDKFTMSETVYLMTRTTLLVASDSGPVALAAATDIAICALYSVVPGEYRLPYRHGVPGWNALAVNQTCQYRHCAKSFTLGSGMNFDVWCPNNKTYACVRNYQPDDFYREITQFLASSRFINPSASGAA